MSFPLKKCLKIPIWEEAFFILISTSAFSFISGVMVAPRYLNFFEKCILLVPLFRMRSPGQVIELSASWRVVGKNMASVFDLVDAFPTCIWSPKRAKWSWIFWAPVWMLPWLWKRKAPSSTYRRFSMLKDDPLDLVGCPSNLPRCFRGLSNVTETCVEKICDWRAYPWARQLRCVLVRM